ncbi:MAG: hypothetical protein QGH51_01640 [Planctomycetota bacterium]|jgi:hypothetical protein|nr:hypothetical protein [Planctomycetota bacterium]MDP6940703.1 hypothetical protein [Planctomycetota bacterium]
MKYVPLVSLLFLTSCPWSYEFSISSYSDATAWESRLDGTGLDAWGFPSVSINDPVAIHIVDSSSDIHDVRFDGYLDFPLFEPVWNHYEGSWLVYLERFDDLSGIYTPPNATFPNGIFQFNQDVDWFDIWDGFVQVDFDFTLTPSDGDLETATTATLDWDAHLWSSGSLWEDPKSATLVGSVTIANKVE